MDKTRFQRIAIVGSGPTGLWTAKEILEVGGPNVHVTLLEAGNMDGPSKLLNNSSYDFLTPSAIPNSSHSVYGGSKLWLCRIGEFSKDDFSTIPNLRKSEWPFRKEDLEKYYDKLFASMTKVGMNDAQVHELLLKKLDFKIPNELDINVFQFAEKSFFQEILSDCLKKENFDFVTGAFCNQFFDTQEKLELEILNENGNLRINTFDKLIIAGGALQSVGLVLRSEKFINNLNKELVGRGLMEHLDGFIGNLSVRDRLAKEKIRSLALNKERKSNLVDFPAGFGIRLKELDPDNPGNIHFQIEIVPFQNTYWLETYFHPSHPINKNRYLKNIVFISFYLEKLFKKIFLYPRRLFWKTIGIDMYSLWIKGEEFRNEDSLVSFQNMKLQYNHRLSNTTVKETKDALFRVKKIFKDNGLGKIKFRYSVEKSRKFYLRPNWHPLGTLRLGTDSNSAVVNENFQLGSSSRVFVVGASTFSTGSNANPVFTALALISKFVHEQLFA